MVKQPPRRRSPIPPGNPSLSSEHPPRSRGPVAALLLVVVVAYAAAGYFAVQLLKPPEKDQDSHPPPLPFAVTVDETPSAAPPAAVDPDHPLPNDVDSLVDEVRQLVDYLVVASPNEPDAWEVQARMQAWLGNTSEAVESWKKCLELAPDYAHAYFGMGTVAARLEDVDEAVVHFRRALAIDPSSFPARTALAEALIRAGRAEEAVETIRDGTPWGLRARDYFLLGQAYGQLREYEKAKESYQSAIRHYPDYREAYHGLATMSARLGDHEGAAQAMEDFRSLRAAAEREQAETRTPYDDFEAMCHRAALIYSEVASLWIVEERLPDAERLLRRGAELSPRNVECRQALAAIHRYEGRLREAIRILEELAAIEPERAVYWLEVGRLRTELVEFTAAEEAFLEASQAAPEDPAPFVALCELHLDLERDPARALRYAQAAVERDASPANHVLLAMARNLDGDPAGARQALARAVELAPEEPHFRRLYESFTHEENAQEGEAREQESESFPP